MEHLFKQSCLRCLKLILWIYLRLTAAYLTMEYLVVFTPPKLHAYAHNSWRFFHFMHAVLVLSGYASCALILKRELESARTR